MTTNLDMLTNTVSARPALATFKTASRLSYIYIFFFGGPIRRMKHLAIGHTFTAGQLASIHSRRSQEKCIYARSSICWISVGLARSRAPAVCPTRGQYPLKPFSFSLSSPLAGRFRLS